VVTQKRYRIGDTITYSNRFGQVMRGRVMPIGEGCCMGAFADGRTYISVKREEWPAEETIVVGDFHNGTYTLLD
jgi:hypothetical protein